LVAAGTRGWRRVATDDAPAREAFVADGEHLDEAQCDGCREERSGQAGERGRGASAEDAGAECEVKFVEQIAGGEGTQKCAAAFADEPFDAVVGAEGGEREREVHGRGFVEKEVRFFREPGAGGCGHATGAEDDDGRTGLLEDPQRGIDAAAVAEHDAQWRTGAAILFPEFGGDAESHGVGGERACADEDGVAGGADFEEAAFVARRGEAGRGEIARADAAVGGDGEVCRDERAGERSPLARAAHRPRWVPFNCASLSARMARRSVALGR